MTTYERFRMFASDMKAIALEQTGDVCAYFCYPAHAEVIGFEGAILYCFLAEYGDMVFACNPESCADRYVYPIAENFDDFVRLVLACGSPNPVEQIIWMEEAQFERHLREETARQSDGQKALLALLQRELALLPMRSPFQYVKALQARFDDSKICYRDEYYEVLGLTR